jgi:hypothetical protein
MTSARPLSTLFRHFLRQFFENELVSPQGELRSSIGGALALVSIPGFFLPILLIEKYSSLMAYLRGLHFIERDAATLPDKYLFLTLSIVIPGLVTILKWDSLFPGRLDHAVLAGLPIRTRIIFSAKAGALASFVIIFAAAANGIGAFLYPGIVVGGDGTVTEYLRFVAAHCIAAMTASAASALAMIALQGLALQLLPVRVYFRVAPVLQFAAVIWFLAQLIAAPAVSPLAKTLAHGSRSTQLLFPPLWSLGIYETVLGRPDPAWHALAGGALRFLAAALAVVGLAFLLNYRRYFRRIAELPEGTTGRSAGSFDRLVSRFALRPAEHGVFTFIALTLSRSRLHRLAFVALTGIGIAIVIDGVLLRLLLPELEQQKSSSSFLLSAPLTVSFFLLASLRFLFEIPAEQNANWVFRTSEGRDRGQWLAAASRAMFAFAIAPLLLVMVPVHFWLWGVPLGAIHTVYCVLLCLLLREGLLYGFAKVPFACSFGAGKHNVTFVLFLSYLAFVTYSYLMIWLETLLLQHPVGLTVVMTAEAALCLWLRRRRYAEWSDGPEIQYHDSQLPAVQTLDLT